MRRSHVVTGGGRGIGRAITEALLATGDAVVVLERDADAVRWAESHPAGSRLAVVTGSAAEERVTEEAADRAEDTGQLIGWADNAAVFRDAGLGTASAREVLELVHLNLAPAVTGCATAVKRFLAAGSGGAIVNVSSHQAQRAVRGALPYVVAKAATEGLTRAVAVDHGDAGIRANTVALGSIRTERYDSFLEEEGPGAAGRVTAQMALLHPLGRVGEADEVAAVVTWSLSDASSYVTGAVIPVDGGRAARGADPEAI